MSQPSVVPGLLSPEAVQLIDGQYADRQHLRPILDAVLAAVPSLGAVTVQARKTLVSLVTPRRTFAIVQATTRNRVDLGLRLERPGIPEPGVPEPGVPEPGVPEPGVPEPGVPEPGVPEPGVPEPAKNLGPATVRISLTEPAELDDEALGWLRLAYEQNAASPPPRRRPAPRPRPEPTPLTVVIEARLVARIRFTDAQGSPIRPADLVWSVVHP
jgi:hypothetical protein